MKEAALRFSQPKVAGSWRIFRILLNPLASLENLPDFCAPDPMFEHAAERLGRKDKSHERILRRPAPKPALAEFWYPLHTHLSEFNDPAGGDPAGLVRNPRALWVDG